MKPEQARYEEACPRWREAVEAVLRLEPLLRLEAESRSTEDGSLKLLFSLRRLTGRSIEAVALP